MVFYLQKPCLTGITPGLWFASFWFSGKRSQIKAKLQYLQYNSRSDRVPLKLLGVHWNTLPEGTFYLDLEVVMVVS